MDSGTKTKIGSEDPAKSGQLPSKENSLKASLSYSFVGQVFYLLSQLGVLSALAHFHGPTAVGQFGLALAVTTPLFLLLNMGFRTTQAVDISEQFTFAQYGGTRLILTSIAAVASLAAAMLFAEQASTFHIVAIVVGAKIFESISNLAYGTFQQAGRMDLVAKSFALRGSITLIAFVSFLMMGADTATALVAQLVVWALVGLLFDYRRASVLAMGKVVLPKWSLSDSWKLLRHSAPLGGGLLANSLQMTATRLMVERFLGLDALGIFTAIGYFQQAGVTASNSVSNAIVNRLARLNRNGQRRMMRSIILRLFLIFAAVAAIGVGAAYFYGDVILTILFGQAYRSAAPLLFIISMVVSLRMFSTLPQSMLFAEQRYKEFMGVQIGLLVLTVALGLYAIPRHGIIGAGFVLLAVAVVRFAILEIVFMLMPRKAKPKGDAS